MMHILIEKTVIIGKISNGFKIVFTPNCIVFYREYEDVTPKKKPLDMQRDIFLRTTSTIPTKLIGKQTFTTCFRAIRPLEMRPAVLNSCAGGFVKLILQIYRSGSSIAHSNLRKKSKCHSFTRFWIATILKRSLKDQIPDTMDNSYLNHDLVLDRP